MKNCVTLELKCAVQTGGIRPFFWKLTAEAGLTGWITKSSGGVILRLEGDDEQISSFIRDLPVRVPSAFRLRTVCVLRRENQVPDDQCQLSFRMLDPIGEIPEIPPDRAPCEHCAAETMELSSRRYCYPFFSCRDCGPGYSLALRSPFIRRNTTLTAFPLCPDCRNDKEYGEERHQNAELLACPHCGPQFFLLDMYGDLVTDANPLCLGREALFHGEILAVQSLFGGFQLFTSALDPEPIMRLRRKRKLPTRPLCLIARNLDTVRRYCECSDAEAELLCSPAAPMMILHKLPDCSLPDIISPDTDTLAVGLPSSLAEKLLFEHRPDAGQPLPFDLLVTCGDNRPGHAECQDIDDVFNRLMAFTDKFLCHDLKTNYSCPQSICELYGGRLYFHRRARGYVPNGIFTRHKLKCRSGAFGCDQQAAAAFGLFDRIIPTQALGRIDGPDGTAVLHDMFERLTYLFDQVPDIMVCDMNPDSFSYAACADFADLHGLPLITIQTHHAHALACMAEHGLTHALALVMNRGSAGPDGTEWGSECLESRLDGFSRLAAFQPLHQEKGRPARHFLDYLIARRLEPSRDLLARLGVDDAEYELWRKQTVPHDNLTHSAIGLINAVCAGIGIIPDFCTYPDRALLLLRKYASRFPRGGRVPDRIAVQFQFKYSEENGFRQIDWSDTMLNLANIPHIDESEKVLYAEAFYNALAESMLAMSLFAESRTGSRDIVLSGSLFQDPVFHSKTCARLEARSFHVFSHISLAGDESCVPVGQAYAAGLSEGL